MNVLFSLWFWALMALGCGVVMAYAMSQRYNDDIILWVAIPLLLLLTVGLVLMVRRNGGGDR